MDPQQLQPQPVQPPVVNPGKGFGIASLVLGLVGLGLFALIFGILGLKKSKQAGQSNGMALAGVIIGSIEIVLGIIGLIFIILAVNLFFSTCADLGTGTHVLTNGSSITCNF